MSTQRDGFFKESSELSREESRYLDGELPPEEMRRLERELAADPDRAARLASYRDAVGLWKQDVERRTAIVDEAALADRVMASIASGSSRALTSLPPAAPRWVAAAAVLLIGIGVAGTAMVHKSRSAAANQESRELQELSFMSEAMVQMIVNDPARQPSTSMLNGGR